MFLKLKTCSLSIFPAGACPIKLDVSVSMPEISKLVFSCLFQCCTFPVFEQFTIASVKMADSYISEMISRPVFFQYCTFLYGGQAAVAVVG